MTNKILKTLTNNFGFKLLAVALAGILWLVVYNLDDPNKTATFTTNVVMENADYVAEQNMCYEIMDGTNTVSFSVTTKRSYLEKLEDTNFTAVADMSRMVMDEDQETATVPIDITSNIYNKDITYGTKKYLKISLDNLKSKRFVVSASSRGKVANGYAVGELKVSNPTVIKISGPESIVSTVDKVVATIDVSDMAVDFSDNVVPILYDADGKEVDTTRLTLSNQTVTIGAKILNTKEVVLNYATSGTPADNYSVTNISVDINKVIVKGTASVLNPLTSIDIPEEVLNIDGAREDIITEVDITEYLPEGVELVDSSQRTITVTISIEGYLTQTFSVPSSNIQIEGVAAGLQAKWKSDTINFKISGMESKLEQLQADSLTGKVNVTGLEKGSHEVRVTLSLDDDYAVERTTAELVLSKSNSTGD